MRSVPEKKTKNKQRRKKNRNKEKVISIKRSRVRNVSVFWCHNLFESIDGNTVYRRPLGPWMPRGPSSPLRPSGPGGPWGPCGPGGPGGPGGPSPPGRHLMMGIIGMFHCRLSLLKKKGFAL